MVQTLPEKPPDGQASCFLEDFPQANRSLIANQFFAAVRGGAATVDAVIGEVKRDAILRMTLAAGERWATQRLLLKLLETAAARAFAQTVIERESLPREEKLKLKSERSEGFRREYLRVQPPTQKQLEFLQKLGCYTTPSNRLHASELIERHK
ncbi:hypothetical protein BH20ACI3_BH20ACI3_38820 [soil metagenome]